MSVINDYIGYLEKEITGVKWEKSEKIHITLKFIGNMESGLLPELKDVIYNATRTFKAFPLSIKKFSALPDFRRPRVLVLELNESDELSTLNNMIQDNASELGIAKEKRKFLPHITIGRVKGGYKMGKGLDQLENIRFNVDEIALINSKLTQTGSIYSNLGVYKLT